MRTCKILHWLVRLWVYSFIPHRDLYKSFHYYSPQKPSGKPEGFCGFQTFPRELCPLGKVGDCGNLPRPWGTINSREEFFHRQSRQKNIFHLLSLSADSENLRCSSVPKGRAQRGALLLMEKVSLFHDKNLACQIKQDWP